MCERKKALLLGMVYSQETEPKRGQEFRDRVRCKALEDMGEYQVFSLDNKHNEEGLGNRHCRANFADARRMLQSIYLLWGSDICFDIIILDYFFCPAGWARERWSDKFFRESLPLLAKVGVLKKGGTVWLPYLQCVQDSIKVFKNDLSPYYFTQLIPNPRKNPLFVATDIVESELIRCPDMLVNETQIRPLNDFSDTPFCVLGCTRAKKKKSAAGGESTDSELGSQSSNSANSSSMTRKMRTRVPSSKIIDEIDFEGPGQRSDREKRMKLRAEMRPPPPTKRQVNM